MSGDILLVIVVGTALAFDFTNGFHDTGNAMATSIATRALPPKVAVGLSGVLNLVGAFLSLAIVIGEFTIATFMGRPAFAPYLALVGDSKPYEQAALALISFGITWLAMILGAGLIGAQMRRRRALLSDSVA